MTHQMPRRRRLAARLVTGTTGHVLSLLIEAAVALARGAARKTLAAIARYGRRRARRDSSEQI